MSLKRLVFLLLIINFLSFKKLTSIPPLIPYFVKAASFVGGIYVFRHPVKTLKITTLLSTFVLGGRCWKGYEERYLKNTENYGILSISFKKLEDSILSITTPENVEWVKAWSRRKTNETIDWFKNIDFNKQSENTGLFFAGISHNFKKGLNSLKEEDALKKRRTESFYSHLCNEEVKLTINKETSKEGIFKECKKCNEKNSICENCEINRRNKFEICFEEKLKKLKEPK